MTLPFRVFLRIKEMACQGFLRRKNSLTGHTAYRVVLLETMLSYKGWKSKANRPNVLFHALGEPQTGFWTPHDNAGRLRVVLYVIYAYSKPRQRRMNDHRSYTQPCWVDDEWRRLVGSAVLVEEGLRAKGQRMPAGFGTDVLCGLYVYFNTPALTICTRIRVDPAHQWRGANSFTPESIIPSLTRLPVRVVPSYTSLPIYWKDMSIFKPVVRMRCFYQ